ncbi:MAG: Na/Pi cotransporter family protein [Oscillospiraceae bacterium]|nr:Na/Pi cotransporter family protein [Oscillospiraceae bacterium]
MIPENVMTVITILSGLALFLFGMKMLSDSLQAAAGSSFKKILDGVTKNRFAGLATGALLTILIQSSSATSVMAVGLVNAGLLRLSQAIGVIMGANIGTTMTGLIVALRVSEIAPALIVIGMAVIMVAKKETTKHKGQIFAGLGILFLGMLTMTQTLRPLAGTETAENILASVNNPFMGILIGIVFTAMIQSSSATTGVVIALGMSGVIPLEFAAFIIFGTEIGTCITAFMATIGASKQAKRVAISHITFNTVGVILFATLALLPLPVAPYTEYLLCEAGNYVYNDGIRVIASEGYGGLIGLFGNIGDGTYEAVGAQIALVHVVFNVTTALLLLPFIKQLAKFATLIIPEKEGEGDSVPKLAHLDSRMMATPQVLVEQLRREVERMARMALDNYRLSVNMFLNRDAKQEENIKKNEKTINYLNHEITKYLVKVTALELEDEDRKLVGSFHHVVNDIERIGDHAENIMEFSTPFIENKKLFSEVAIEEMRSLAKEVDHVLESAIDYLASQKNNPAEIDRIKGIEDDIDHTVETLKNNHVERLNQGKCTPDSGMLFVNMLGDFERVSDHASNIATYRGKRKKQQA